MISVNVKLSEILPLVFSYFKNSRKRILEVLALQVQPLR